MPADVERVISPNNIHYSPTRLICIENPHNRYSGRVLRLEQMKSIAEAGKKYALALHLDGARIFNAAISLGVKPEEIAKEADSVMFCLAKGLAAPAGALLCGSKRFIERARENRQKLGGGMAKVGILAAAGIVALGEYRERIVYDHENAILLGMGIAETPQFSINLENIQTNVVVFEIREEKHFTAEDFVRLCQEKGIRLAVIGKYRLKAFTHYGIERENILETLSVLREIGRCIG